VVNGLRSRGLVTARMDGRADKYEQHLSRKLNLNSKERAVACVLMLRGALTLNEIRINTGRMVSFDEGEELQGLIQGLIERDEALVMKLPRASGQREERYVQLLCGEPDIEALSKGIGGSSGGSKVTSDQSERITQLEKEVLTLKQEVIELRELIGQK